MRNMPKEKILEDRSKVLDIAKMKGDEVIETVFDGYKDEGNIAIKCLAKSIEAIAEADAVIFMEGYEYRRGCQIEHQVCLEYDKRIIYEEDYLSSK
jgi:hypothetical protein